MSEVASFESVLRVARTLMDAMHFTIDEVVNNSAIPTEFKDKVRAKLESERLLDVRRANVLQKEQHTEWLPRVDRAQWYYWPTLRNYLLDKKAWLPAAIQSIDDATDKILAAMEDPIGSRPFTTKGLVVGYVQSGKTANYTALIAKAVDAGYRVVIVLTGIHNSLRLQTQRRLASELVGVINGRPIGVGRPPADKEWQTLTSPQLDGDFNPGHTNPATMAGPTPFLIVTKKNATVLAKLIRWLNKAPQAVRDTVPCLIIDDEADQASPNTGGNRQPGDDMDDPEVFNEDESPSKINEQIRSLLGLFGRKAYVAYTATPFANVLMDPNAVDRLAGQDLYPHSFIVSLPKPHGYYGAKDIFGLGATADTEGEDGLDVVRNVKPEELPLLLPSRRDEVDGFQPTISDSLYSAIIDFILGGAARLQRGHDDKPATMLIHTTYRNAIQERLTDLVESAILSIKNKWRYERDSVIDRFRDRWEEDFRRVTRQANLAQDVEFAEVTKHIGTFLEQVTVQLVNSQSEDELDYERDPDMKVIVVGGNRLSRGLTLEGLLVSFFVRRAAAYDTLMQMGRWFGYREGYEDLMRIYTTKELEGLFRYLAGVEEDLRLEIARYELERLTPLDMGVKIQQHPSMAITSPLKMQNVTRVNISYAGQIVQTITFPFEGDASWFKGNIDATRTFLRALGSPSAGIGTSQPVWTGVEWQRILEFLGTYKMDQEANRVLVEPLRRYIQKQASLGELTSWAVSVRGRGQYLNELGALDLGIEGAPATSLIERTRLRGTNSLKAIATQVDQGIGLSDAERAEAESKDLSEGRAYRAVRRPQEGLLLIYPISKRSGYEYRRRKSEALRGPIYADPSHCEDVIGLALVFPESKTAATVEYVVNSVGVGPEATEFEP